MLDVIVIVKGKIDPDWAEWLGGLALSHLAGGQTQLSGLLADQAALYGVLSSLSRLGLGLVSLRCQELKES